jgi:hypothetical protein
LRDWYKYLSVVTSIVKKLACPGTSPMAERCLAGKLDSLEDVRKIQWLLGFRFKSP